MERVGPGANQIITVRFRIREDQNLTVPSNPDPEHCSEAFHKPMNRWVHDQQEKNSICFNSQQKKFI
jgi:hypothetical protein